MATKSLKPKGGSCCAVATCINYAGKVKRDGKTNISFYRFPKDPELQKKWTLKFRRGDSITPSLSYMCSEHFSDDAYIRDLKAELLAYTPKFRKLKPDAMLTINLPVDHTSIPTVMYHQQHHLALKVEWNQEKKNRLDNEKKKRVHWSTEDISKAFTLRYFSKRAYSYVKDELHYPLPGLSSLQRSAKNIDMRNGIREDVIRMMKLNGDTLQDYEKLTVLMFDEVKISSTMEYDVLHDEVVGPHSQMQVVMARGIASQWKQPIYVGFDQKMTKSIFFSIIDRLDQIGFNVVCCVSDCGGGNVVLWKALDITYENPIFSTPNEKEIVFIPDAPHILKLIRNWLLDTGFQINEQLINKKPLESLIKKTLSEINICYKLSEEHLTCEGPQRQKVKLASQLLSHTTATALLHYKPIDDTNLLNDTANFIELVNNWFDLSNVSHPNDHRTPYTAPYGLFLDDQDALLDKMYNTFLLMRCNGKYGLQIFQKALLMHINGMKLLLKIVRGHGLKYILTSKVNQDALENLFSQLRTRGGLNDHPSPLNALYRLRMIILGKNPGVTSNRTNTTNLIITLL
ncbi:unnamed protein product [Macrosiphum euphorbiae]|uniref:THAP-type domain-containing protein n=1 Tax=Macrosiphum euphorbiae TaxID=13131 RepID=A0AAV0WQK8_9HEMI|nr:unnamed protein product [Macrosiphum euphorbiae]